MILPNPNRSERVRRPARSRATMNSDKIYSEPSEVTAEDGEVIVDGPDAVAVSLTPEAAIETSNRLFQAGVTARGQKIARGSEEPDDPPVED
jgi:hypothetical protein